jgi:hypothetical protein
LARGPRNSGNQTQAADVDSAFTFDLSGGAYTLGPTNGNAGDYPLNIAQSSALTATGAGTLTTPGVALGGSLLIQNNATVHVTGQIPASAATSSILTTFDPGVTTSVSVTSGGDPDDRYAGPQRDPKLHARQRVGDLRPGRKLPAGDNQQKHV